MGKKHSIVRIQNVKNNAWIADKCIVAESFFSRLKGLIGTSNLAAGEALLLRPCNDIHMWFMKYPIDVVFLKRISSSQLRNQLKDQDKIAQTKLQESRHSPNYYEVTSVREKVLPWKVLPVRDGRARETLELPLGSIARCDIQTGDQLCIS